jgi:hypothetical protein
MQAGGGMAAQAPERKKFERRRIACAVDMSYDPIV